MLRDLGQAAEAAKAFARATDLAYQGGDLSHSSWCRDAMCGALMLGPMPVKEAIQRCEAEIAIVEGHSRLPVWGWWSLGLLYAQNEEPVSGLTQFQRAETVCRGAGLWNQLAITSFYRSALYELAEDWARGTRASEHAEQLGAIEDRGMRQLVAGRLARALVATGKLEEADGLAKSAAQACDADDFTKQVAWRQALALVHAQRGGPRPPAASPARRSSSPRDPTG